MIKKLTTAQRILSPSFLCAWLVMGKVVSPTVFVWIVYWYTLRHCTHILSECDEECKRMVNVYFCTDLRHNQMKTKKNGRKINIEKKVQIFSVFMCQSVSNGFLLKWNKHKTPADTSALHCRYTKEKCIGCKGKCLIFVWAKLTYLLT